MHAVKLGINVVDISRTKEAQEQEPHIYCHNRRCLKLTCQFIVGINIFTNNCSVTSCSCCSAATLLGALSSPSPECTIICYPTDEQSN